MNLVSGREGLGPNPVNLDTKGPGGHEGGPGGHEGGPGGHEEGVEQVTKAKRWEHVKEEQVVNSMEEGGAQRKEGAKWIVRP